MQTLPGQRKSYLKSYERQVLYASLDWNEIRGLQKANEFLKEQAASLQIRSEELEAYAHTVAHDLKNPLSIIIASCDAIREISDLTRQELQEFTQQINYTAFEMNKMIDSLLLLSEVSKANVPISPLEMSTIVGTTRRRLGSMLKEYHGSLISPQAWPVALGYAPWIEEVWANYISNALKYGGQTPIVRLGATIQLDGRVRFWVSDNGPGIPMETRARLFIPYAHIDRNRANGHGLGLSIVQRIIEKLGGQVGFESEAGQGSLFYFNLPAAPSGNSGISMTATLGT
jgi:two-component system sensor histidine kinase/response regulator